jgi:DNA-binding GntR family transcriptional regulator
LQPLKCQTKIEQVRAIHDRMIGHYQRQELPECFETNRLIHELISEGSGNQTLVDQINSLSARVRRARFNTQMTPESWAKAVAEHEAMIQALESRAADELERVIINHVETKQTTILGVIAPSD